MQSKLDYYLSLPRKRMGAGVLFFNERGELLVVQPSYKDTWEIPGGVVEENESPKTAAIREVKEELGISISPGSLELKCMEYMGAGKEVTEAIMFVFSAGAISNTIISSIRLAPQELKSYKFIAAEQLLEYLGEGLGRRVMLSIESERFIYSEGVYS